MTSQPPPPAYDESAHLPVYDDVVIANRLQQVEKRLQKRIADVLKHNDVAVTEKAQKMVDNILLIYEKRFDDLGEDVRKKMDAFKDWSTRLGTGEQTLIEMDKKLAKIHDKVTELDAFHAVIKRHEEREKKIHGDLLSDVIDLHKRIKALEEREERSHDVLIDEGVMRHIEKMVEMRIQSMTVSEKKPYIWPQRDELSKIAGVFGGKFLDRSTNGPNGPNGRPSGPFDTTKVAPLIVDEIKKVFKDETLAFVDYTYSKAYVTDPGQAGYAPSYFTRLNYLNLITNKGNIYTVAFLIDNGNVHQDFSNYLSYAQQFDLKVVKYDETINTTEKNWTLVDLYTKTHNGIYEDMPSPSRHNNISMNWEPNIRNSYKGGMRGAFLGKNGILTIMSDFEK